MKTAAASPMRAALYCRVSNDPKATLRSVSEQEAECRDVCDRNHWDVAQVFIDNDTSASAYGRKRRPAYEALTSFIADGGADVLVTWEASRATRDLGAYVDLRTLCQENKVLWNYKGQTYDLNESNARFATGLDILLSEKEAADTSDRILRSVRANIVAGRPYGKRPFGYRRTYDPESGRLVEQVIREDQAEVVREIARRLNAGETCYAVAQDFNKRGISTPTGKGTWDLTQVKRIAVSPTYIAKRVHKGEIVADGKWPSIYEESTHYQLVARLTDPKRRTVRDSSIKHLLSGIATCGVCGGSVKVGKPRGVVQYLCKEFHTARKVEWVDALVVDLVIARLSQPEAAQMFVDDEDDEEVKRALDAIAEKRARLDTFYEKAAKDKLSAAGLARVEATMLNEIDALEKQVRRVELPTTVCDLAESPAEVWEGLSIVQRREVIRVLLDVKIMLSTLKPGSRAFDPNSIDVTWKQNPTQAV